MFLYKNVLSRLWNLSSESSENMKGRGEGVRVIDGWSQWGEDLEECGGSELQRWEVAAGEQAV